MIDRKEKTYRHEFKYLISDMEMQILQDRIKAYVPLDPHVGEAGSYNKRSLYFDDYSNRCYYENENGTDPREKFRIRIYNSSSSIIKLECKRKENGMTHKSSCKVTHGQVMQIINREEVTDIQREQNLLRKLLILRSTTLMQPVVIVDYERVPYIFEMGNVRITFDKYLGSSTEIDSFFEPQLALRPVMPAGMFLMEVKYDGYLPDPIYDALQLDQLQQTAFSKYYLCRKYTI